MKPYTLISLQRTLKDPKGELIKWFQWSPARRKIERDVREDAQPASGGVQPCPGSARPGRRRGTPKLWHGKGKSPWRTAVAEDTVLPKIRNPTYTMNLKVSARRVFQGMNSYYSSRCRSSASEQNNAIASAPASATQTDLIFAPDLWPQPPGLFSLVFCEEGQEGVSGNSAAKEMSNNPLFFLHRVDL